MATTRDPEVDRAALDFAVDADGIAWVTFDRPEAKVNILTSAVMRRLDELIDDVAAEAGGTIRALVVRSGKSGTFIAGADIDEIKRITDPAEATAKAAEGQRIFGRIEALPIPSVAAIGGVCLGGGTELVLACRYRLAADTRETRIGLPEVRLGILPGFGGTVRLPRLVGLGAALELILTGKPISARRAERIGLVDELVAPAGLDERARTLALEGLARWKGDGRRPSFGQRLLYQTMPGRRLVLWQAHRRTLAETKGHYPAPLVALDAIRRTITLPPARAFEVEADAVGALVAGDVSKNLIHVFQLTESANKATPAEPDRVPERLAVLGAGVMGGGIAQLAAYRDLPVRLKDIKPEAIGEGLRHARQLFDRLVRRGSMDRRMAGQAMNRIAPALDYAGFPTLDAVIEAVVEDPAIKERVLREVEEHVGDDCVLASNTSSISISRLQGGLTRPDRFCGMHFFNPVHRMPLVEVIRGAATSDQTVSSIFHLARRLGKTPLIVNDGAGFLVNRILGPYLNEAGWLLSEGAAVGDVDRALLDFGMPMGPFRLLDEVGFDVASHAAGIMHEAFGERMRPAPALAGLGRTGRLGRKGGSGFYRYKDGTEKGTDDSMYAEIGGLPAERTRLVEELIVDRTVLAMVNEAARALEDGIVSSAGAVDLGMIMGTGFPPFRGGLLRYADTRGLGEVLARLRTFTAEHGERFEPAPLLTRFAEAGRGFYEDP